MKNKIDRKEYTPKNNKLKEKIKKEDTKQLINCNYSKWKNIDNDNLKITIIIKKIKK